MTRSTDAMLDAVAIELGRARARFPAFNSPHEGWAVIKEELDELWEHVRANTGRGPEARREAVQIAAMALRYALDCVSDAREEQRFVDDALHWLDRAAQFAALPESPKKSGGAVSREGET